MTLTPPFSPRGEHRVLYVSDPSTIARHLLPDPTREQDLRQWVDMLADSGVDTFNQEVFSQGWTAYWRSEHVDYDQRLQHRRFLPLLEAGTPPLEILIDQSHKRGMRFIGGFRMNDGHAYQAKAQGVRIAKFIEANPHLQLTERPEGEAPRQSVPLDFSFEPVREFTLGVVRELSARFDIDGVELCFRDDAYFPPGEARERAALMTDLVRKIRDVLDQRQTSVGRKRVLGVRVPATIEECAGLGLDVPTWIKDGSIDYVSPMDTMYADFNLPYAQWAELTRSSNCLMYPGMLPWVSHRSRYRLSNMPLSTANCRALAHTMYGAGADGISLYNHQVVSRFLPFYPQSMQVFHQLRDPARVARGERHYRFEPTWAGFDRYGAEGRAPTGVINARKLVLDRHAVRASGDYRFNLHEDLEKAFGATLAFRGFGLSENDELEVHLNGHRIPDESIRRTWRSNTDPPDGTYERQHAQSKIPSLREGGRIDLRQTPEHLGPEYSTRWFTLSSSIMAFGENRLSVTLVNPDPQAKDPIVIDELEIWVEPK